MVNDDLIPVKDSKYGSNLEQIQILSICAGKYCSVNSLHFNYLWFMPSKMFAYFVEISSYNVS